MQPIWWANLCRGHTLRLRPKPHRRAAVGTRPAGRPAHRPDLAGPQPSPAPAASHRPAASGAPARSRAAPLGIASRATEASLVRHGRSRGGPGVPGAGDVGCGGARSHRGASGDPSRGPAARAPPQAGDVNGRFGAYGTASDDVNAPGMPSRGIADGSVTEGPQQPPTNGRVPAARSRPTGRPGVLGDRAPGPPPQVTLPLGVTTAAAGHPVAVPARRGQASSRKSRVSSRAR